MRIGLICYPYPPQSGAGGVGTYMFRLAGALARARHDVHVIAGPSDRPPIHQPGVHLHRVPAVYDLKTRNRAIRWAYWNILGRAMSRLQPMLWHLLRWDLAIHDAILELDRAHGFDVIESPEFAGNGWQVGRIHRWPILVRMHCPWELFIRINKFPFNPMDRLMAYLERKTVRSYADYVTAPSEAMKREAEKNWTLRRPIHVIPNFMQVPAEPAPLPPEDGPLRIVCTGRIERLKGQDTLCRAFAMIHQRHPRAELWIVGPDRWGGPLPFHELLKNIVPDPAARARIHLTGMVALPDVEVHLRAARIAVVASTGFESFSLSGLEAMAAARPMIVTRVGALPELIDDGRSGLTVEAGSALDMALALDRLLSDRAESERFALAAHETARSRYDESCVLPRIVDAYQAAAEFFHGDRRSVVQRELTPPLALRPAIGA